MLTIVMRWMDHDVKDSYHATQQQMHTQTMQTSSTEKYEYTDQVTVLKLSKTYTGVDYESCCRDQARVHYDLAVR